MLSKLPTWLPTLQELMKDLGLTTADVPKMAQTLGVSERTVWRWKAHGAPKMALLSLWWLSRWGHSLWDSEMANRTALYRGLHDAMFRELRKLRDAASVTGAGQLGQVGRPRRAANEPDDLAPRPEVLRTRATWSERRHQARG